MNQSAGRASDASTKLSQAPAQQVLTFRCRRSTLALSSDDLLRRLGYELLIGEHRINSGDFCLDFCDLPFDSRPFRGKVNHPSQW
jgi:hypothetical protein